MNWKKKALDYINKLILKDSQQSSKRFLALYVTIILVTFIVVFYTNLENYLLVLGELLGFVIFLVYGNVREKISQKNNNYVNDENEQN